MPCSLTLTRSPYPPKRTPTPLAPPPLQASHALEALWLVVVLVALLAASRAAFVVPFVAAHNAWAPTRLSNRDTVIIWWAGLMRGAVSVALVYYYFDDAPGDMGNRQRSTLIVATLMVRARGEWGGGTWEGAKEWGARRGNSWPWLQHTALGWV